MDWEVPSHADGGPEGQAKPLAVPTGSGSAATGQDVQSAGPATAADDLSGDQDGLTSAPDRESGFQPDTSVAPADTSELPADTSELPAVASDRSRAWPAMFRRAGQDPAGQDRAGQRRARHSAARRRLARPRLARPQLSKPQFSRPQLASLPLVSRPLVSPRLAADPRVRIWAARTAITVVIYFGFMLWHGWRLGLTIAALYAVADIIFRSKTTAVIPPAIRVTAAQRSTRRRLKVLQPAGYLARHACTIPGRQSDTQSVIDHLVVGPAGVFALDSERWDRRLPVRAIGGRLYHGPVSQEDRLRHARWEAQQAAALIGAKLGHPVKVHPAMIIYGPGVPWVVNPFMGVDVFDGGRVGKFFRGQTKATVGHHLDAGQIAAIYAAAAEAMPPMP